MNINKYIRIDYLHLLPCYLSNFLMGSVGGRGMKIQHRHVPFTYSSDEHMIMLKIRNSDLNTLLLYVTKVIHK